MKKLIIREIEGIKYSKESQDKNKIHLDYATGYNSIYGNKIVHGTLVILKFIKTIKKKIERLNNYSIKINFQNSFKYNQQIFISKNLNKISQINEGKASIKFKKKIDPENKKLKIIEKINIKKSKNNQYEILRIILNNLSRFVGMVNPGKNSIILNINIFYSTNFKHHKNLKIFTSPKSKTIPIINNRIVYKYFIVEFISFRRPELVIEKTTVSKKIKNLASKIKIPVLILGAGSGIGKELLNILKHNKKVPIIATHNVNKIQIKQNNIKILKLNLNTNFKILDKVLKKYDNLRIYYFASPKIDINKQSLIDKKKYKFFYIDCPKKILWILKKKKKYVEFFYPSTIFINTNIISSYVSTKLKGEKMLLNEIDNNTKINVLRMDKINTKQNLSLIDQKLPNFIQKINKEKKYQNKIFFL